MDFVKLFADAGLELDIHGLASAPSTTVVNQVWRTVCRSSLPGHGGFENWKLEVPYEPHKQEPEQDSDAILLLKESLPARHLSQQPMLMLPSSIAEEVDFSKLEVAPRNKFPSDMCKEPMK